MHCSLQVLQTPLVPNMDERRLRTERPNWCRIKRRNKQGHANVCARASSWIWSASTILCLFFWFPPICVHICVCSFIFHFNYGEDNSSVCANSTQTHTLLPSAQDGEISLYVCSHCASCVFHMSAVRHSTVFPPMVLAQTTRGQQSLF